MEVGLFKKTSDYLLENRRVFGLLVLITLTYFTHYLSKFWPLGVTNGWYWDSNFGDLNTALKMTSCSFEYGFGIYKLGVPDGCGGYTYGFLLALLLDLLGVKESHSSALGVMFFIALILSILAISKTANVVWKIPEFLLFFIFISPGFWLAIVHGSFDIPVYLLLVIALFFASKQNLVISFLIVLCTVFMKLFTLPLLLLLALKIWLQSPFKYKRYLVLVTSVIATISTAHNVSLVNYADSTYRMAQGIFHTFGIESLPIWLEITLTKLGFSSIVFSQLERKFLGLLLLIFITCILSLRNPFRKGSMSQSWKNQGENISLSTLPGEVLIYFGVPFLALFMQGQNYDNKLMFLSLPVLAMFYLLPESRIRAIFVTLVFITFWFTCFFPDSFPDTLFVLIQITGDVTALMVSSLLLLGILEHRKAFMNALDA